MHTTLLSFCAGDHGPWRVVGQTTFIGAPLPAASFLTVDEAGKDPGSLWTLKGFASNLRYTTAEERTRLNARQAPLGRPGATHAALIPIRKSERWWALAQDERRAIYERSGHLAIGSRHLPAISRKLIHCRDIGEPFDFLTWFDFTPDNAPQFNDLVAALRETEEWSYVDREVDIRLQWTGDRGASH